MDEHEDKALDDIEKYGCHILMVMEGEGEPCFTYSIGINKKQEKPDVVILGLNNELASKMINLYNDRISSGENIKPGKYYSGFLEGFDVCFVKVAKKYYNNYFGWGLWLHNGDKFDVLQMVWPTTQGLWPWSDNKLESYTWAQPILNEKGKLAEIKNKK